MQNRWLILGNSVVLIGGLSYFVHTSRTLQKEMSVLTSEVKSVHSDSDPRPSPPGESMSPEAIQDAVRRGTLSALAATRAHVPDQVNEEGEVREPESGKDEPSEAEEASPATIRAFDEANRTVATALERKVWTREDMENIQTRFQVLDPVSREQIMYRLVQAVNAQELNIDDTRGFLF